MGFTSYEQILEFHELCTSNDTIEHLEDLAIYMLDKAKKARQLMIERPQDVQFDSSFMPWIFDAEDDRWLGVNGNYSAKSPREKVAIAKESARKKAEYHNKQINRGLEDHRINQYWSKVRQDVLERDGYKCQCCGEQKKSKLHIHHILKRKEGGTEHYDNLITICNSCHTKADGPFYDVDWGVEPIGDPKLRKNTQTPIKPSGLPESRFIEF